MSEQSNLFMTRTKSGLELPFWTMCSVPFSVMMSRLKERSCEWDRERVMRMITNIVDRIDKYSYLCLMYMLIRS